MARPIGVLSGGGDAPGLNAVIRAVVKTATNVYDRPVVGFLDGMNGFLDPKMQQPLTPETVRGILHKGGTILGTASHGNPFLRQVVADGQMRMEDVTHEFVQACLALDMEGCVCIGGDGTLSLAYTLFQRDCPVVGVPKTIDNDLLHTDYTFGFNTAVLTATEAIDKLHTTAESHHRVMVLEVMGRNTGWIALQSGIAGGADVILIPEIPYDIEEVAETIRRRERSGSRFSIVVVAEGATPVGGEQVFRPSGDELTTPRLGGIGNRVADDIARLTGYETRTTVLGHLQRGGTPTPTDRVMATRFGVAAVDYIMRGRLGVVTTLRGTEVAPMPLKDCVHAQKLVDPEGQLVRCARSLGISVGA